MMREQSRSLAELARLRSNKGLSVSVCLPSLNEAATIGDICAECRGLIDEGLIQELIVIDTGSTDTTKELARAAGADVYDARELLSDAAPEPLGKGGALWKSLAVARGDVVVWMDSDTRNFRGHFVAKLLQPLLLDDTIRLTKAFYDRPPAADGARTSRGGARVTELAFRPLAHLLFPELTEMIQPLSGEYAGYREDLIEVPFFSGYGVETGLLIDLVEAHGASAIAQVDLGTRLHKNQEIPPLGRMAFQVIQVMMLRAEQQGRLRMEVEWPRVMRQFESGADGVYAVDHHIDVRELPPMKTVLATIADRD